ncbi:MAG: copper resistance protein CopD [Flavobacterium sp.]|uniref:copper resistance protein CopD n=1 Tax=Flavobacterium sp. TaxID=239 RepID=UPI0022BB30F4|nr:copper resistance protein CopD [Flavobacterium sp.]MCZ8198086.1 copper resistance protein CopD [Flavobacterium sp.]
MLHQIYLIIHLLAATIWVGGHLILLLRYVPKAIKTKSLEELSIFRKNFEPVGMPSLFILIITGILMAYDYNVTFEKWFLFENSIEKIVSIKLILLLISLTLAFITIKFVLPSASKGSPFILYFIIFLVTTIAVTMLVLGSLVRIGGL